MTNAIVSIIFKSRWRGRVKLEHALFTIRSLIAHNSERKNFYTGPWIMNLPENFLNLVTYLIIRINFKKIKRRGGENTCMGLIRVTPAEDH